MGKAILSQQKQIAARLLHQSELRSPTLKPYKQIDSTIRWDLGRKPISKFCIIFSLNMFLNPF